MENKVHTELMRMRKTGVVRFFRHHVRIIASNLLTSEAAVYAAAFSLAQRGVITFCSMRRTEFEYTSVL